MYSIGHSRHKSKIMNNLQPESNLFKGFVNLAYSKCSPRRLVILLIAVFYLSGVIFVFREKNLSEAGARDNTVENGSPSLFEIPNKNAANRNTVKREIIAVLVLVCDRLTAKRTVDQLIGYSPDLKHFPIVVSKDCGDRGRSIIKTLRKTYKHITFLKHPNYEATEDKVSTLGIEEHMKGYYHIADHYGWALNYTFNKLGYESVIVVEDDLEIAVDFYEYFEATLPVLRSDPNLWCVSAYNDNGKSEVIDKNAPALLYRTDFFGGLGWMLTKDLWNELSEKWPYSFWDDWMRASAQRKGRACIHPEVSRTKTFGKVGVSNGQFFDKYLRDVYLNKRFTPFKTANLGYLIKENYDQQFLTRVNSSAAVENMEKLNKLVATSKRSSFKLFYNGEDGFREIANQMGIMEDFKDKVPRNGYMGIVPVMYRENRVYLVPTIAIAEQ